MIKNGAITADTPEESPETQKTQTGDKPHVTGRLADNANVKLAEKKVGRGK